MGSRLSHDATGGNGQKIERGLDVRALLGLPRKLAPRLFQSVPRPVERLVSALEPGNRVRREAAPLQPRAVEAIEVGRTAGNHDVRRNVRQHDGGGTSDGE